MPESSASQPANTPRVLGNASLLLVAQFLVTPLTILVNAVAARTLGTSGYGRYYQALTFTSFVFLFVEWGQSGALTRKVAVNRADAGELLGSGIAFRACAALVAAILVPLACLLAGYDRDFIIVLSLCMVSATFGTVAAAGHSVFLGYERTDVAAATQVGGQLLTAALVVPTLLLGGGLEGVMVAQMALALVAAVFTLAILPRMKVPKLSVRWATIRDLVRSGHPFLVFALVLALQPMIDAAMLSKFSSADSIGWYAAARKLVGVLVYPASALTLALYLTLCRLHAQDMEAFRKTASDALYSVTIVVVPVAVGCALFPELGIAIFGERAYGPAEDDLRVLAPFVFLVYFSMPIGSCLASSGRQSAWTAVQLGSVVVSAVLDPFLIGWFQEHSGNGGLGVCVAAVLSEVLMVAGGLWLMPKGILPKIPRAKIASALASGVVMVLVALSLTQVNVIVRAVIAVLAYVLCLQLSGGFNFLQLRSFVVSLRRR
ncbi:MAG: oligosaccharide flippase family protein [Gammaproteobacteria bacterium]